MINRILFILIFIILNGCASRLVPAPIETATHPLQIKRDKHAVANSTPIVNRVSKANEDSSEVTTTQPLTKNKSVDVVTNNGSLNWQVPTKGKIIGQYSNIRKGIDITGHEGQSILAANDGKVLYSGNGLKGYGNLIIIQHKDNYLTAYAHNKVNVVKEGDLVKGGQKIAEMGSTDSKDVMLHFELRQKGKPLNPSDFISIQ